MPNFPPPPVPTHDSTRRLHETADACARADGHAWVHPDGPSVVRDLLTHDEVERWQREKSETAFLGERCASELPMLYARYGTTFGESLIHELKRLETARAVVLADSGMQALALAIDALLEPGDHVVISRDVYAKTKKYLLWLSERLGLKLALLDGTDVAELERRVKPETKLVIVETFSNPMLRAISPSAWSDAIVRLREHAPALRLLVDDTIATPWGVRTPLLSHDGIDIVVASGTKALGGEDRTCWGFVASNDIEFANAVMDLQSTRGGGLSWQTARDALASLSLADERHAKRSRTALTLAEWLSTRPEVEEVWYPALPSHPDHATFKAEYVRGGSLVSIRLRDADEAQARHFADVLAMTTLFRCTPSFDGLLSKVNHHKTVSEFFTPEGELRKQNIDRVVRLAPGLEAAEDLQAAIAWALENHTSLSHDDVVAWSQDRRAALGLDTSRMP